MVNIVTYYEARFQYDNDVDFDTGLMFDKTNKPVRGNNLEELRAWAKEAAEDYTPKSDYSFHIVKITVSEIGGKFSYEENIVEEF